MKKQIFKISGLECQVLQSAFVDFWKKKDFEKLDIGDLFRQINPTGTFVFRDKEGNGEFKVASLPIVFKDTFCVEVE